MIEEAPNEVNYNSYLSIDGNINRNLEEYLKYFATGKGINNAEVASKLKDYLTGKELKKQ